MKKYDTTYVLDTSVLMTDPLIFKSLPNSQVIICLTVLEELDKRKKFGDEGGKNARAAIRLLDEVSDLGDISTGVLIDNNCLVKIDTEQYSTEKFGNALYGDTRIIACAHALEQQFGNVVLLSNDINLRIRAKSIGIQAEHHERNSDLVSELYSGFKTIKDVIAGDLLLSEGWIEASEFEIEAYPNQFIIFTDRADNFMCVGRMVSENRINLVERHFPWSLKPRNLEQEMAVDLLLDTNVPLVSLVGKAGSGKTLAATACAMQLVLEEKKYNKIIIFKSMQPLDKSEETGFLPGNLQEKLSPFFSNIDQAIEFLFTHKGSKKLQNPDRWRLELEGFMKKGLIQYQPLTYIRGQSIKDAVVILDEAQNISKSNMKSFLTRAGENTKVILTGDIDQIDNEKLDPINNGLTQIIDRFKCSPLAGNLVLNKCERSKLAEEAVRLL